MDQTTEEIIKFLKGNVEIFSHHYGPGYRTSAYLTDGTFLPCVMFCNPENKVRLAIKRFADEKVGNSIFRKSRESGYADIVKNFVTTGNLINNYDISRVEISRNALPLKILEQIHGETTMGWTGFVVRMKDQNVFGFGTRFRSEFFQMPEDYLPDDIAEIINHSYLSKTGQICAHTVPFLEWPEDYDDLNVFKERPYFDCFIDGL
jgi:hypothetical protein